MEHKHKNNFQPKEEILIVQLIAKYINYLPLFIVFFIVALTASFFYLRYAIPKYQATASLIIKDEKKGNDDSKLIESLNMMNSKKIIENEIEVLQSRPLVNNVVKKLNLYAPVFIEGNLKSLSAYKKFPLLIECKNPDSIVVTKAKVYIKYDSNAHAVFLNNKYVGSTDEWLSTKYGVLKFKVNTSNQVNTIDKPIYFTLQTVDDATKNVLKNLKVTASNKLSSVIELKYKAIHPKLAEDILNEILIAYNNLNVLEKNNVAKNTLAFLEARLNVVATDLDSIEKKIQLYKANAGAVDISTQGQLFLQNVSTNDQKLSDINSQLSIINELENQLLNPEKNISILPASLGVLDGSLSQSMSNLTTAELEREKLKKTVAENNPLLISVNDQIQKLKTNIVDNIQTQRKTLEANKKNLNATNNSYNSLLQNIPIKERQLLEISRDQNIKSGIYAFLLQKREESELSYVSTLSDSRVVNFAQSNSNPVSPNKLVILGIAFTAVLGIPIVLIGVRETFSATILYRQEIESLTNIPIIGEINFNKSNKSLVVEAGKRTAFAEEFRKIRFSLLANGINEMHKKILITSSISGEGKSFVAANLAISFSLSGKKVALIDLDLHNSSLGKIFNKQNEIGVTNFLMNEQTEKNIIHTISGYNNLFFVPSGSNTENASELLENGKINQLIQYLENHFDILIIDSAPVVLVTDAHILSQFTDATLYVVRHSATPKVLLKRFDKMNEITPLNNLSIVFNGVKVRGYLQNNYGYGYGYVYGQQNLSATKRNKLKAFA